MNCSGFMISCCILFCSILVKANSAPVIYVNQVAFDSKGPKVAIISIENRVSGKIIFKLIESLTSKPVFSGLAGNRMQIEEWMPGKYFYRADFSTFVKEGTYKISIVINDTITTSAAFVIGERALAKLTIPAIIHYYNQQRANTPAELKADSKLLLFGSNKTVDLRGGWCDASGDVSKYFSHLAYTNFMMPQQTPLVTWSMISTVEAIPKLLTEIGMKDPLEQEALWGADYIMRSLSAEDYFYMTVFSYFKHDPSARRVVGLLANSVTTDQYQCAFREGGGMAIAALARVSRWKTNGNFSSTEYLSAAKRAFAHLLINNTRYDDDGKENIIDDYGALMAATELWIATGSLLYRTEARKRADNIASRMDKRGYFLAGDGDRPFWHASDAGLPVVALSRYLVKETSPAIRKNIIAVIRKALDYNLRITNAVTNPFGYPRQSFVFQQSIKEGFFIPHENESGWWWQGENARLGSLATAAIVGGRLTAPKRGGFGVADSLAYFASQQTSWILGANPYSMCFMYGFGNKNVPYMASQFGHGSEKGGISNGITGKDGNADGTGIDFKETAEGNEWRWTEQWIPHAAWFLQAVAAMSAEKSGR